MPVALMPIQCPAWPGLVQGHVMYYGQAAHTVEFFGSLGCEMPYGINAADFILDLASGDVAVGDRSELLACL